ncbi:MAG: Unknown protein [uncultured Sulfurovum sp.]|uniref:Uncharacterized protein n=1 Tax=uncultured Sulfurovum sp. TaxID=269237 RepID=A0A6S6UA11_9BACT|nr:MAG: Unknown protein [uncultured Sulfurovum sp.]
MVNNLYIKEILILLITSSFFLGCNEKNIEGSYIVLKDNKPFKSKGFYTTATFGKKNFSFSTGVGGTYEVNDKQVIMQGSFSNTLTIQEDNLLSDEWLLKKSTQEEIAILEAKAKKELVKNKPIIGDEKRVTKW